MPTPSAVAMAAATLLLASLVPGCSTRSEVDAGWTPCPTLTVDFRGIITEKGPPVPPTWVVSDSHGRRNGTIVLHVRGNTTLLESSDRGCRPTIVGNMSVGDTVEAEASGHIIETNPPQTLAQTIVVRKAMTSGQ